MKKCMNQKCKSRGKVLPAEAFSKDVSKPNSLSDYCRECKREHTARRNLRMKENKELFKLMFI